MTNDSLRPREIPDYKNVVSWLEDPTEFANVCGNVFDFPLQRDAFVAFFVTGPQNAQDRLCFKWCENESQNACGMISYSRIDWKNDYGHIGFVAIAPELRRRGIGKAMVEAMLQLGFEEHGFHRIDLVILDENKQARKFYEKRSDSPSKA